MINKKDFYEKLKPFAKNKYSQILLNFRFGHYELIFEWTMCKPNGEFDPIMYVQLINVNLTGAKKYVVPDLFFNCIEEGITSDFKLYKYLDDFVITALNKEKEDTKDDK